jgi:hypothetical protein
LLRLALYGGSFVLGALTAWASTVALENVGLFRDRSVATADPAATADQPTPEPAQTASPSPEASPSPDNTGGPAPADPSSTAAPHAPPPTEAGLELSACVQHAFAPNSFPEGWAGNFSFLCEESDPRRASHLLRGELVRAGGKRRVTPGMREWSMLGWYNMASFAAIRGHCCPQPAPLRAPSVGACPDLTQPLNALLEVVAGRHPRDPQRLWLIRESYRTTVQCLDRAGFQGYYDQWGVLRGGEDGTFDTMLGRILEGTSSPPTPSAPPNASAAPGSSPPSPPPAEAAAPSVAPATAPTELAASAVAPRRPRPS